MEIRYLSIKWILLLLFSCNQIENSNTLSQEDINHIKSLNLIDDGERVYKFYSEYKKSVAGNFFTDRRIATYWIDERNAEKNEISFAFYEDIINIDTVYNAGVTYSPYMLVTKKDSTQFKVSVNGKKEEIRSFFEEAIQQWKSNQKGKMN
jgi:hypothetical protein